MKNAPFPGEGLELNGKAMSKRMSRLSQLSRLLAPILLLLTFFVFTIPQYVASVRVSGELQPYWAASDVWMQSAECARTTGIVLAICSDGQLIPFADRSPGDDPGHALALGIYLAVTHKTLLLTDISIFNSSVNYIGIALLAVLFYCLQLPLVCFLVLTLGPFLADEY